LRRTPREEVFEFAERPRVAKDGDRWTLTFESKGACDTTVAVVDRDGKIVRHLASGVLGPNAPAPLEPDSLSQKLVWDGKDDQGRYVDDTDNVVMRVSLGLRARFERHFLWSPHRRISTQGGTFNTHGAVPAFCARPEGVYVFDGRMFDHLRLFDHEGNYVRTVYPFPADKLDELVGVKTHTFAQSGETLPLRGGTYGTTLLTSGTNYRGGHGQGELYGVAATAMAVRGGRIALVCRSLNRLGTDGSTGGLPLEGPETHVEERLPRSAALSPDGETLYVTGFSMDRAYPNTELHCAHGVGRIAMAGGRQMEVFAGSLTGDPEQGGSEPGQFKTPTSVDCDPQGRVYVADHFNNRVQVFSPAGEHLKSIAVTQPSEVCIHQRTGEIYVFSWYVDDRAFRQGQGPPATKMTHFGPFDDPKLRGEYALPIPEKHGMLGRYGGDAVQGRQFRAAIDSWAPGEGPTVWMVRWSAGKGGSAEEGSPVILRMDREKGQLVLVKDFGLAAKQHLPRLAWSGHGRDRLFPRPTTGELYVLGTPNHLPVAIDPETGRSRIVELPFSPDDMAFDINGYAYLRTHREVVRYDVSAADGWREVPFDYGESRRRIGTFMGKESGEIISAIPIDTANIHHEGGIWVSPKGHIAVAFIVGKLIASEGPAWKYSDFSRKAEYAKEAFQGWKPWTPPMFPGRGGHTIVRVWDEHGQVVYPDAVQGVGYIDGVFIDKDDNLYVTSAATRTGYFDKLTGTLVKLKPQGKILSTEATIPLEARRPDRPPDTTDGAIGTAWWEDAEWFYGGIGFNGKNHGGIHACHCAQFRITQDYFARTFAPETVHYTVGVLDSAGNLILRIGQYGNVDDGVPLVPDPRIPNPRPRGGDEVALFHPAYLAVHTDRRLFINDPGTDRILSVKLGYHTEHKTALKDVPDDASDGK